MAVTPYRFVSEFEVPPPGDERKYYMCWCTNVKVVNHYTVTICYYSTVLYMLVPLFLLTQLRLYSVCLPVVLYRYFEFVWV